LLVITLAGFGGVLFDATKRNLVGEKSKLVFPGRAIRTSKPFQYDLNYISYLASEIRNAASPSIAACNETFFCLIYFNHLGHQSLVEAFCPASVNYCLPKSLLYASGDEALREVIIRIRDFQRLTTRLNFLYNEEIRRTPWLLPFENYRISEFQRVIKQLNHPEEGKLFLDIVHSQAFPKDISYNPKVHVFSDDRNVLFVPARRRDFHGCEVGWIDSMRWVKGAFRLGRSVPVGFHYDAKHKTNRLDELRFLDCEKGEIRPNKGDPYINITPNDRLRLAKR
jgi:hypothetical protein